MGILWFWKHVDWSETTNKVGSQAMVWLYGHWMGVQLGIFLDFGEVGFQLPHPRVFFMGEISSKRTGQMATCCVAKTLQPVVEICPKRRIARTLGMNNSWWPPSYEWRPFTKKPHLGWSLSPYASPTGENPWESAVDQYRKSVPSVLKDKIVKSFNHREKLPIIAKPLINIMKNCYWFISATEIFPVQVLSWPPLPPLLPSLRWASSKKSVGNIMSHPDMTKLHRFANVRNEKMENLFIEFKAF